MAMIISLVNVWKFSRSGQMYFVIFHNHKTQRPGEALRGAAKTLITGNIL